MRKTLTILVLLCFGLTLSGQTTPSLQGKVICRNTGEPVMMATVVIKELNIWATTNEKGEYQLRGVPTGTFTLVVSCLGYVDKEEKLVFPLTDIHKDITVEEATLAIDDVVVTAQEGKRMASGSVIEQTALEHVQPTDLSDVMQLLPGQLTQNPDLSGTKQLSIREISVASDDNMASLGTLLIVDGASVSNDANMQFLKTSGGSTTANFSTSASGGTDVRQIPVDNIESIEVIRGIASVENGDMLSGAVKVTTKKGKTPLTAKIKIDPGIKQFYAGKGLTLGPKSGTLNIDFDYTRSLDDIRTPYQTFNRLNGGVTWSNTFLKDTKPLILTLTGKGTQTLDLAASDPTMKNYEEYSANETGVTLTLNTKWALNSKLFTNLNFMVSGNMQHQVGHEVDLESLNGIWPQPTGLTDGEYEVALLPSTYTSDLTIDGKPFYFESKLSGNKSVSVGNIINDIVGGVEYKVFGNNGQGRIYDLSRPPVPTSATDARPRPYTDIPALGQLAMYLEENFSVKIGETRADLQAGLRFTNVQPEGLFSSKVSMTMLDPRFNLRYKVIQNKKGLISNLTLRTGYGFFSKAPSLLYFYPDKAYWDKMSFNYVDDSKLIVMTTKVFEDRRNYNLKPAENRKFEAGVDATIKGVNANITYYAEEMTNGFDFEKIYNQFIYNKYESLSITGLSPYFIEGEGVFYVDPGTGDVVQVNSYVDTTFVSYSYPTNNNRTIKKGLEFTLNFGTVKALRTSFILDGAYQKVTKQNVNNYLMSPSTGSIGGDAYPYVGLYPGGDGTIRKRLNTNLKTVTHIKELRMVVSLTTQVVWIDKTQNIYNDMNGNPIIYTKNPVDDIYSDDLQVKYYNPIGYYDEALVYHEFDASLATEKPLIDLIENSASTYYYKEQGYPVYFQFNIKLTKEITDMVDFSFYANNFTSYRPLVTRSGVPFPSYYRLNNPLYFGAELKLKF